MLAKFDVCSPFFPQNYLRPKDTEGKSQARLKKRKLVCYSCAHPFELSLVNQITLKYLPVLFLLICVLELVVDLPQRQVSLGLHEWRIS